jgi:hypothetical protein
MRRVVTVVEADLSVQQADKRRQADGSDQRIGQRIVEQRVGPL